MWGASISAMWNRRPGAKRAVAVAFAIAVGVMVGAVEVAASVPIAASVWATFRAAVLPAAGEDGFARIVAALAEVLRLDVADVQKAVPSDAEIDKRCLDAGL